MKRTAHVVWNGNGKDGNGTLSTQSGALKDLPYSFKTRFQNDDGKLGTNPEELITAAHAGCFNMKLSFVVNENDFYPDELTTDAELTFDDGVVESIELKLNAKISNIGNDKFQELAEIAKNNCPISGLLKCDIKLVAVLD
jgi:osmotically inducible protein OsmC